MNMPLPQSFIAAWFDRVVQVKFDCSTQRREALQKAAARISGEAACQIIQTDTQYICYLVKRDPKMYKSVPFIGLTIVRRLPDKDAAIADRFLDLVKDENSKVTVEPTQIQTASRSGDTISPLGIIETLIAISASALLATYLNSFTHIIVGTLLAPIFLLRTNDVNDRIIRTAHKYFEWISEFTFSWYKRVQESYPRIKSEPSSWTKKWHETKHFFSFIGMFFTDFIMKSPGMLIGFQLIKLGISAHYAIYHPLVSLSQIPGNWRRIALSANSRQTPEVLPGIEDADEEKFDFAWWRISSRDRVMWGLPEYERPDRANDFFLWVWLPAYITRLSFKSTTLFWSPLLWVAYPLHQTADIVPSMKRMRDGAVYKVQRLYSFFIVAAFVAKILLFSASKSWLDENSTQPLERLLWSLIVPNGVPPWQIAAVTSAIITLMIYFVADHYVHQFVETETAPGVKIIQAYQTALILRNILSIYIVVCTGYILIQAGAAVPLAAATEPLLSLVLSK